MQDLEQRRFRLHARESDYQQRVQQAQAYIEALFDGYDEPYISVSGGKDSTVLHHLATQRCGFDGIDVFHFDWGLRNVPGVGEHVRDLVDRLGGNLVYRTSEKVNDPEHFANDEHHGMAGIMGWVRTLQEERDWDVTLLGIRAEESASRRDQYTGDPPMDHNGVQPTAAPIHHLTTEDIWSYIVEHDLPYHDIYDEQGELFDGIDSRENRLVTVYDHEFDSLGSETISQFLFPEATNKLKEIEQMEK